MGCTGQAGKILKAKYAIALLCMVGLFGEIIARTYLGLGTPPIFVRHPTIEYMNKPNQDVRRFGTRQLYNELGMRSDHLKTFGTREVVMVFGDSVVNGGALTDHANLATSRLTNDRVVYANISAGSWGPQNIAAYWQAYKARLPYKKAVLVLSSHDYTDIPTFAALDPETHPTTVPVSALWEGLVRYLPRYLPAGLMNHAGTPPAPATISADIARRGEQSVTAMISQFHRDGVSLCIVRHYTLSEMKGVPEAGDQGLRKVIEKHAVPFVDLRQLYPPNVPKETFFRDNIHFDDAGQKLLANAIAKCASFLE